MILYITDLLSAIDAYFFLRFVKPDSRIERRWRFLNAGVSAKRKQQLPWKILEIAYKKRLGLK